MIKEIIKEELVEIHFQPIVSIRSKQLYAFEALTRCTYKGEVIPPYELFNLAIDANLNLELDVLTRNKSIEKFKEYYLKNNELRRASWRMSLRVNFSGEVKGVTPEAVAKASLNRAYSRWD